MDGEDDFRSEGWSDLFAKSDGFRSPKFGTDELCCPFGLEDIHAVLKAIREDDQPNKSVVIRCYKDAIEAPELLPEYLDSVTNCKPDFSDLEETVAERFGMIVNGSTRWSPELRNRVHSYMKWVAREHVEEVISFDLTLFIGNYGYTPFGAHLDSTTHRTVLFNLGPKPKEIHLWDTGKVKQQFGTGVSNILDPDSIDSERVVHELSDTRPFLLPPSYFHVGYTHGMSVTCAIILVFEDEKYALERELARTLAEEKGKFANPISTKLSLTLEELMHRRNLRVKSNLYFTDAMQLNPDPIGLLSIADEFSVNDVEFRESHAGYVFLRGSAIQPIAPTAFRALMDLLEGKRTVRKSDVLAAIGGIDSGKMTDLARLVEIGVLGETA